MLAWDIFANAHLSLFYERSALSKTGLNILPTWSGNPHANPLPTRGGRLRANPFRRKERARD